MTITRYPPLIVPLLPRARLTLQLGHLRSWQGDHAHIQSSVGMRIILFLFSSLQCTHNLPRIYNIYGNSSIRKMTTKQIIPYFEMDVYVF